MNVIVIMACAIVGTIIILFLAGAARWSFIYLIRYRWLKREVKNPHYELSGKRDHRSFTAVAASTAYTKADRTKLIWRQRLLLRNCDCKRGLIAIQSRTYHPLWRFDKMNDSLDPLKLENQHYFPLYACSKEVIRLYKPFLDPLELTYINTLR